MDDEEIRIWLDVHQRFGTGSVAEHKARTLSRRREMWAVLVLSSLLAVVAAARDDVGWVGPFVGAMFGTAVAISLINVSLGHLSQVEDYLDRTGYRA